MKKCKFCRSDMDENEKICPSCNKKQSKNRLIIAVIIILIIVVAALKGGHDTIPAINNNINSADDQIKTEVKKEVILIDFSNMSYNEILAWCDNNKIKCCKKDINSDSILKGNFVSQSTKKDEKLYEGESITVTYSLGKETTLSQKNALKSALSYLDYTAFSYTGLIKQLEYEKYSNEDAVYAADNCGADWNEQALKSGKVYLDYSSFSRQGLIDQLKYEGFTQEQSVYAVNKIGL